MPNLIAKHGGYKNLKSFQMAEIVYDLTFEFVSRYIHSPKQKDQMEGAARGGKQNIAEGSKTSGTSKQSELRLVDVARASQEELKLDFEDFLRINKLPQWGKDDARSLEIRKISKQENRTYRSYMTYITSAETAANCLLCLVNQTCYLLDQQLRSLEQELGEQGDFKERYKQEQKQKIIGPDDNFDRFLKEQGLKRLENGQVVSANLQD